jgi:hypothetical protein
MTETVQTNAEETLSPQEIIAQRDKLLGIEEYDIEETLDYYPVKRSDGTVESNWLLIGEGIDQKSGKAIGKFVRYNREAGFTEDGQPKETYTKYLPLEAQRAFRSQEQQRLYELRAETAHDLGEDAVEQVVAEPVYEVPQVESDVDEHARLYKPGELKAMKEQHRETQELEALMQRFPALEKPQEVTTANNYDYLFAADERQYTASVAEKARQLSSPESKAAEYYKRFVTPENSQVSQDLLVSTLNKTPELREIFDKAGITMNSPEAVDAVRENPTVRAQVAGVLVEKLDRLVMTDPEDFGWRVADNSPNNLKADPHTGQRMLSRDYAVTLALKMLGGEFSERIESDNFARDEKGRVADGQHRHAARALLMSW